MKTPVVQRWRDHRDSYRPARETIKTKEYEVAPIREDRIAKGFVLEHHYASSYPAARFRFGLYHGGQLCGVAVFSVPANYHTFSCLPGERQANVELGRFVLLDEVPANGETWFLARAFRLLVEAKPEIRAVLSYSDTEARTTRSGRVVTPGHVGTIYQALNGRHVGRSSRRVLLLDADGQVVSGRSLTKIRKGERGAEKAYERLVAAGAPRMSRGESPVAYVRRALAEGPFRRLRHPGNLAYVWAVGEAPKRTRRAFPPPLPFVKRDPLRNQFPLFG